MQSSLLVVDTEILRTISLRSSLQNLGQLWRIQPREMTQDQLVALWGRAKEAEGYDIFLSHTWHTSGVQKFGSVLLVFHWHHAFLGCFFGILVALLVYATDAAPALLIYVAQFEEFGEVCPFAPWTFVFTLLGAAGAFLLAPYIPDDLSKQHNIFLDVACIHQTQADLKERGIYGIGGWLSATKELRVLWSSPYLSRFLGFPYNVFRLPGVIFRFFGGSSGEFLCIFLIVLHKSKALVRV